MTAIAIVSTGLVTSVGLSAPAACAAIRSKLTNPSETRFLDSNGQWVMAHQVPLERPWRGIARLSKMASQAIAECLAEVPSQQWSDIPLLLCVAERERPGRTQGLEDELLAEIQNELGVEFGSESLVIPQGRIGVAVALKQARHLIREQGVPMVIIAATDSLVTGPTLSAYEREQRLLTANNSNGFMPGEGASALLIATPRSGAELLCVGLGFGMEPAHVDSGEPLRADGLVSAHRAALENAKCDLSELVFRITDLSGEQYYFKEADLALSRLLRVRQEDPELWHPAESTGACGAALGGICFAVAHAAFTKQYAPGPKVLCHFSDDQGRRASVIAARGT